MFINCVSVIRELSDSLPSDGDRFDCNAANRIIEAMYRALDSILTLQLAALELELRNLLMKLAGQSFCRIPSKQTLFLKS